MKMNIRKHQMHHNMIFDVIVGILYFFFVIVKSCKNKITKQRE